jgi:hypothetical protein
MPSNQREPIQIYCPQCGFRCMNEPVLCPQCGWPLKTRIKAMRTVLYGEPFEPEAAEMPQWTRRGAAIRSLFVPGWGQVSQGHPRWYGWVWFLVTASAYAGACVGIYGIISDGGSPWFTYPLCFFFAIYFHGACILHAATQPDVYPL